MHDSILRSEERSEMLDSPKSSAPHEGGSRDTTIQTTCATLPPDALNGVNMSFTQTATQMQPTRVKDTMDSFTSTDFSKLRTMKPPDAKASGKDIIEFVKYQLDRIGRDVEILDGLLLLGAGRTERLEGGAATSCSCVHSPFRNVIYLIVQVAVIVNYACQDPRHL